MGRPKHNISQADISATDIPNPPAKRVRKANNATASDGETAPIITKKNGKNIPATAAASRSKRVSHIQTEVAAVNQPTMKKPVAVKTRDNPVASKSTKPTKITKPASKATASAKKPTAKVDADSRKGSNFAVKFSATKQIKAKNGSKDDDSRSSKEEEDDPTGISYWLMKAEPESRIEKGKDVKFSIDDLAAREEPEKWDGVRNLAARNNIRAMMKGDQAFFYHSNCKTPGIAGIMEIVQEHSVDESAFDKDHPYYDEKSLRDKPKWFVVDVEFRHKFAKLVKLKELQQFSKPGGVLENMQTLRQSRLSVSKVTKKEWDFILGLAEDEQSEAKTAQPIES